MLKNSRSAAKEYQASVTKYPRNIELLNTFFYFMRKDFNKKSEKEKSGIFDIQKIDLGIEDIKK